MRRNYYVREISASEVEAYATEMRREMLTLAETDHLFGCVDPKTKEILGWGGVKVYPHKYVFKTAFVPAQHRRRGIYRHLLEYRLANFGDLPIEAYCTEKSLPELERRGFRVARSFKNGCHLVKWRPSVPGMATA